MALTTLIPPLVLRKFLNIHVIMYVCLKTITIRDDIYLELVKRKRDGESFSDVIGRLLKRSRVNIGEFFGCMKDSPLLEELESSTRRLREMARFRT